MWARGGEESEYWLCLGHREEKWLIEPMPHSGREARKRPFARRRARATMAARHTSDTQIRRLRPSGRAAAASAAMRTRATKATRRTGVNNASMTDDPRMMTSPPPPRQVYVICIINYINFIYEICFKEPDTLTCPWWNYKYPVLSRGFSINRKKRGNKMKTPLDRVKLIRQERLNQCKDE